MKEKIQDQSSHVSILALLALSLKVYKRESNKAN